MTKSIRVIKTVPEQRYVQDIFVSVVVAAGPDSEYVGAYLIRLTSMLRTNYANYEIIVIANNVRTEELQDVKDLLGELPCIRLIILSKQHDLDTAIFAGLDAAIGDYVCTLDQTLDPTEAVSDIIALNETTDIVQGVSTVSIRGVIGAGIGRRLFYSYNKNFMNIDIPLNATYFMAFNRKAINAITGTNRDHRHLRHLIRIIGFKLSILRYTPVNSPNKDRTIRGGVIEALETITSYSTHPLRVVSWLGVVASFLNLTYAIYVVVINLINKNVTQGWTTTSLQLSGMFFILFLSTIIISEYIGRILSEQRNDQKYLIDDEFSSTISIANIERKNTTK